MLSFLKISQRQFEYFQISVLKMVLNIVSFDQCLVTLTVFQGLSIDICHIRHIRHVSLYQWMELIDPDGVKAQK